VGAGSFVDPGHGKVSEAALRAGEIRWPLLTRPTSVADFGEFANTATEIHFHS
jgi:hypothetical protein